MAGKKEKVPPFTPPLNIDRNSFEPAYIQLVELFKRQIACGDLRPGDRLPSESQICNHYKISPMTVRRAINILADQGVVDTAQGRGTFVRPVRLDAAVFQLKVLQEMFADTKTRVSILEATIIRDDPRVEEKMRLLPGTRVIFIRRLIISGERPFFYHREYLLYDPRRALVESELEITSLRGLLRGEKSEAFKFGELSIEATVINDEEATILQVAAGSAAFNLEHTFFDYEDQPVSWGQFICPRETMRFTTTIGHSY